jgi:CRP-like cAMP-binding protein
MKTINGLPPKVCSNLLEALKPEDLARISPDLVTLQVEAGNVLYEPGDVVRYAYFPCGPTLISFMVLLADARAVETALIGREGAVGGIVSQGRLPAYCRAVVQFPGKVLRIETTKLERAKQDSPALRHMFARYADCLLAMIFQSVACNATHSIEQRTAKWLLAAKDRTGDEKLSLTQAQLGDMMGVGRSYVSRVIGVLKTKGAIKTSRVRLDICEPEILKGMACGCNDLVRDHFEEVLKGVYPRENDAALKVAVQ